MRIPRGKGCSARHADPLKRSQLACVKASRCICSLAHTVMLEVRYEKITGELGKAKRCPSCRGHIKVGIATIPFVFAEVVIVVKNVPAEICQSCHEPFMQGKVTDNLGDLLKPLRSLRAEILVISYEDAQSVGAATPA